MDDRMKSGSRSVSRKYRWSAVDAVLILLLAVAIAGGILRVISLNRRVDTVGQNGTKYEIYFEVEAIHGAVIDSIGGGDAVYLLENDARLGQIATHLDAESGQYVAALYPEPVSGFEKKDHVVADGCFITANAEESDKGLLVGKTGVYLEPGTRLEVRTDRAAFTLRVTEIGRHS